MSRVGLQPITIEEGVEVKVKDTEVIISGNGNEIVVSLPSVLTLDIKDKEVFVKRVNDEKQTKSIHGTVRMLIFNAIQGLKHGCEKKLELVGVGYRAKMEGTTLVMSLGLNHPVKFESPEGITIEVPEETKVTIKGYDKQKVGEFAAKVRDVRKPEPYKGKGIRYEGEYVRRKSSKSTLATE
ncbi:50S ribosomal protein L6 [Candidatus Dojkabacteria bacterium]|uniref:Large ribosomal subunit protein uL6 n=1 Tax=Candidatus Dojkabacteria bacterium TaxID=2099670 RepID=A0A847VDT3_9BACT|nr:50S ribosomal protein L6 [Candidatus Dojkabacteria bacterium]